ncbi:hypothetical protein ANN_16530 [Periplaneta americana]|uniref:Uncharacterized protein n=1 Tax=Periplaneta americana TaxID=6978 RepID=A0ABQ8SQM2_PERAM|nr:hypothetical protein ANN_16530 [Periplaneta americana]
MNKVSELIGKQLDSDSRVRVKNLGTPRHDMVIIQQTEGKNRKYNSEMVVWMRREERNIRKIRSDLGEHNDDDSPVPTKRHRNVDQQKEVSALETCDIIVSQAEERFRFTGHLAAAKLFRVSSFQEYCNRFPEKDFAATVNT